MNAPQHFNESADVGASSRPGAGRRAGWSSLRLFAAGLAAALLASVFAVAAGGSAGAQPVAAGVSADVSAGVSGSGRLLPPVGVVADAGSAVRLPGVRVAADVTEGAVDARGNRLLAGADRYATAVLLAGVPLDAGDAATDNVIVVSGESLVDAVSVVSLAASRDATVVLTETGRLPGTLESFVAEQGFASATIGGGINAVSNAVRDDLAELVAHDGDRSSGSTADRSGAANADAERIQGPTRYETAVAAAAEAGEPGVWCDGRTAAILVSGVSLVDGVVAAPVAYAMNLPLLFTEAGALPDAVVRYLDEAGIERVVIVGSGVDVSGAVLARLDALGVMFDAFDGATAAERSVALAVALEGCASQPVAPGEFALLDANQPVDGVAAAAALATGLGAHSASDALIPVLAVGQNTLPQPVADFLADAGERYGDVTLYPLGGTARLTPQVISRAVAAAEGDDATSDAAGVPAFAATVDLDGDGELSFDELYPADTPHRDAYLEVSDGVAPPGAFAPPVPDLLEVRNDYPRRSELSLGRSSHDRFPNGFPLPPGAPDYATTTFDERQQLRAETFAVYAKPDPSWGAPRNTARGQWGALYDENCKHVQGDRLGNSGRAAGLGFETFPCEWVTDWNIWQCQVLNEPAVTRLAPHEQWTEMVLRYYDLWVDSVGRDRFYLYNPEMSTPTSSYLAGVQYGLHGFWKGVTYVTGINFCAFRIDDQPTAANETFHNQQVTEMHDHFNTDSASSRRVLCDVWLTRNSWYLQRDPAASTRYC